VIHLGWRDLAKLLAAFALWSGIGLYAFPGYAQLVTPATSEVLQALRPHGLDLSLANEYPYVRWGYEEQEQGKQGGRVSFTLLVYNTVLYLSLVSAWAGLSRWARLLFAVSAAPVIFVFHVVDLGLTVESRVLSILQAQHYDFLHHFGLWFSLVKYYNFLSITGLKQVIFLLLFLVQWKYLDRPRYSRLAGVR